MSLKMILNGPSKESSDNQGQFSTGKNSATLRVWTSMKVLPHVIKSHAQGLVGVMSYKMGNEEWVLTLWMLGMYNIRKW